MINHQNYESWFLDYAEGQLSKSQQRALMVFLAENNTLMAEFEAMDLAYLEKDALSFPQKNALKRPLVLSMQDNLLIAGLEGDLSEKQRKQVAAKLKNNPALQQSAQLYQASVLSPDLAIKYPNKKKLKQTDNFFSLRKMGQIAAVIVLLVAVIFAVRQQDVDKNRESEIATEIHSIPSGPVAIDEVPPVPENSIGFQKELVTTPKKIALTPKLFAPKSKQQRPKPHVVTVPVVEEPAQIVETPVEETPIVNQSPRAPKPVIAQAPPKPILEPELPKAKPVLVHNTADIVAANAADVKYEELEARPSLVKQVVQQGVAKIIGNDLAQTPVSLPVAVATVVGKITKTDIEYKQEEVNGSKHTTFRIGRFGFVRKKRG